MGLRLFLDIVRRFPLLGRFITRVGFQGESQTALVYLYPAKHIAEAIRRGELVGVDAPTALDVVIGCTLVVVARLSGANLAPGYITNMLVIMMRALGVPTERASEMVSRPLAPLRLGPDMLLVRSHENLAELRAAQRRSAGKAQSRGATGTGRSAQR